MQVHELGNRFQPKPPLESPLQKYFRTKFNASLFNKGWIRGPGPGWAPGSWDRRIDFNTQESFKCAECDFIIKCPDDWWAHDNIH